MRESTSQLGSVNLSVVAPGVYSFIDLVDRLQGNPRYPDCYTLPGGSENIALNIILNDRFKNRKLRCGESLEGLILAFGLRPAGTYADLRKIPIELSITDQTDVEHVALLQIPIRFIPAQIHKAVTRPRDSLLSRRDSIVLSSRSFIAPPVPKGPTDQQIAGMLFRFREELFAIGQTHKREKMPIETETASAR
jgi:hypothetical protein